MMINEDFLKLKDDYFFSKIEKITEDYKKRTKKKLINLGIGDICYPIPSIIIKTICEATKEMEKYPIGYGPSEGYLFLRKAIQKKEYKKHNISADEIFISNGAKNDSSNIQELFSRSIKIAICDPIYPVYINSNILSGKVSGIIKNGRYKDLIYLPCNEENNFQPSPPAEKCNLIYLCSPNNPTGTVLTRKTLQAWVDYAQENNAIIIYDAAYASFISNKEKTHSSIYEIKGADKVAIEIKSFSKNAGFTGLRCSYMVIPFNIKVKHNNTYIIINELWKKRLSTKFGGVPYPIQKAAEVTYSPKAQKELAIIINKYKKNALLLKEALHRLNFKVYGGEDSPYLWWKVPINSWDFFYKILNETSIISLPGSGFGQCGNEFIRLSAFAKKETISQAIENLNSLVY